jgi:small-conductance mechanosensitive channel
VILLVVRELGLRQDVSAVVTGLAAVLLVVGGTFFVYKIVNALSMPLRLMARRSEGKTDDIVVAVGTGAAKIAVVIGGIIVGAEILGLPYEGVIAGLGVGGLAMGFAARDSVSNFLGAATVMADRSFETGDLIQACGEMGVVEDVGLRSTRIRTLDDSVMAVPNSQLADQVVTNWSRLRRWKVRLRIPVEVQTPRAKLDAFVEGLFRVCRALPKADDEIYIGLKEFGESSIDIDFWGYIKEPRYAAYIELRHRLVGDIVSLANELGVGFGEPIYSMRVASDRFPFAGPGGQDTGAKQRTRPARSLDPVAEGAPT